MSVRSMFGALLVLLVPAAVASACSSFSENTGAPPDDGGTPDRTSPESSVVDDAGTDHTVGDGSALRYLWSFEGTTTSVVGDPPVGFELGGAKLVQGGLAGDGLSCPSGASPRTFPATTPFSIPDAGATFVVWFNLDPEPAPPVGELPKDVHHTLFVRGVNWTSSAIVGPGYALGYRSGADPILQGGLGDGTAWEPVTAHIAPLGQGWHMAAFVVAPTSFALFVDGVKVQATARTVGPAATLDASVPFELCKADANELLGKIDELSIYDRPLPEDAVEQLYTAH